MTIKIPTWDEAMEEAKLNVGKRYTMVPVENSPSQEELEEYARKLISRREDFNKHQDRIFEGQLFLKRHLLETLSAEEHELVYDFLYDVMDKELVDKLKTGERL